MSDVAHTRSSFHEMAPDDGDNHVVADIYRPGESDAVVRVALQGPPCWFNPATARALADCLNKLADEVEEMNAEEIE